MHRWAAIAIIAVLALAVMGSAVWFFAYGIDRLPDARVAAPGLRAPVQVSYSESGAPIIEAANEPDAYEALGYVHGAERGFMACFWRQAASGGLSQWLGASVAPSDELALRLALEPGARAAYRTLPPEEQALLAAYARGMNAALSARAVRLSDEFSAFQVDPAPWEPWHALLIERLWAWLSTAPPPFDHPARRSPDVRAFLAADSLLRSLVHVHGAENSLVWAFRDSAGVRLYQRHVQGSGAAPLYQTLVLRQGDRATAGSTLPGLPAFIAGVRGDRAWGVLPGGAYTLTRAAFDSTAFRRVYSRLTDRDGAERLVSTWRSADALAFAPEAGPPGRPKRAAPAPADTARADSLRLQTPPDSAAAPRDSTWVLRWEALSGPSDFSVWRALPEGGPPEFRLFEPAGAALTRDGAVQAWGPEALRRETPGGFILSRSPWLPYVAAALDSLAAPGAAFETLRDETYSAWAAALAPSMTASVDSVAAQDPAVAAALEYLRNWDYRYTRISIAAAIFDRWVARYQASTGRYPAAAVPDTVFFESARRYLLLKQVVGQMRADYGDDMSQWRWGETNPDVRRFLLFSADTLAEAGRFRLASNRFKQVTLPKAGHPTALQWHYSPMLPGLSSPAAYEIWMGTADWGNLHVRRRAFDFTAFLSRYRLSDRMPQPLTISVSDKGAPATVLAPTG